MLKDKFSLNEAEITLLTKTMRQLRRKDRRYYFKHLKPKEKAFKQYIKDYYASLDSDMQKQWVNIVAQSMLDQGGEPDLSDSIVMSVIGRLPVYNHMRQRAETEGIKLNALANFGGMGAVIMLVGAITALVLYLLAR
ncbi:hypothetical protein IT084_09965 [Desulfallas sp. Bu1-1]|jgi:hypothetical protein|nr:hypothetical protein [Desulfallas sp. Bu1-1]